jgi:group I intron endonuclease
MVLYEYTNKINGKGYVGVTKRHHEERWYEHLYTLRNGCHENIRLQNAYNKYGEQAFEFKIRETFNTLEEMNNREDFVLVDEKLIKAKTPKKRKSL